MSEVKTIERKQVSCITINTDASFHPEHKVGGYAFYIVCNLFKIQKGGMFKINPKSSKEAEEMCIGNAIATLLAQKELPSCKHLVINGDCKYAFNSIKQGGKKITAANKTKLMLEKLRIVLGNPETSFRYVKAHNGTPDARSWVNDWCDKEAKKWMRLALKKVSA